MDPLRHIAPTTFMYLFMHTVSREKKSVTQHCVTRSSTRFHLIRKGSIWLENGMDRNLKLIPSTEKVSSEGSNPTRKIKRERERERLQDCDAAACHAVPLGWKGVTRHRLTRSYEGVQCGSKSVNLTWKSYGLELKVHIIYTAQDNQEISKRSWSKKLSNNTPCSSDDQWTQVHWTEMISASMLNEALVDSNSRYQKIWAERRQPSAPRRSDLQLPLDSTRNSELRRAGKVVPPSQAMTKTGRQGLQAEFAQQDCLARFDFHWR